MKKLLALSLIILSSSSTFAQDANLTINESKTQLEKAREVVKDGTKTISQTKTTGVSFYNDFKEGTVTIYDDLKSLGIEGKEAMKNVVTTIKQASVKTWDLLVKQQLVWSLCYLTITISSIFMFFRFLKQFKTTKIEVDNVGNQRDINIGFTLIYAILTIILSIYSTLHFEQMLTGFINPEFGALRTLIELGSKIK